MKKRCGLMTRKPLATESPTPCLQPTKGSCLTHVNVTLGNLHGLQTSILEKVPACHLGGDQFKGYLATAFAERSGRRVSPMVDRCGRPWQWQVGSCMEGARTRAIHDRCACLTLQKPRPFCDSSGTCKFLKLRNVQTVEVEGHPFQIIYLPK